MKYSLPNFKSFLGKIFTTEVWVVLFIALFVNHFTQSEHFPLHPAYKFPIFSIGFTFILGGLIFIVANLIFTFFKRRYFAEKVSIKNILLFYGSVQAFILLLYIPAYLIAEYLHEDTPELYYFLVGLFLTLLLSTICLVLGFAKRMYDLYTWTALEGKLSIKRGEKTSFVKYEDIAYFYSLEKIVYLVKVEGSLIHTDFSLSQLESMLSDQSFFRINRKIIVHVQAVSEVLAIENGKLSLQIQPAKFDKDESPIIISRYKKQAFQNWLGNKQE